MKSSPVRSLAAALAAALLALPAAAQVPVTPRALGMGGAYLGVARGQEALWENPANLGLPGNPSWSFAFPQLVVGETVTGLTFSDLNDLGDFDNLSDSEKASLLAKVPAQGTGADVDLRLPVAALSMRGVAVGVSYNARVDHGFAKDLVDLFLNGYDPALDGARQYSFTNTAGHGVSYIDLAVGHGRRVGPLSVGVTGHYYIGRTAASLKLDPTARYCTVRYPAPCVTPTATVPQDVEVQYYGVQSSGGHGYGLDVGAAFQPIPNLTLGAVVQNLVGDMSWDEDLTYKLVTFSRNDYEGADLDSIRTRFDKSETAYTSSAPQKVQDLANNLFDGTDIGRVIRVGAAYAAPTGTTVAADFRSRGDEGARTQGMWKQSFSLGVQQKLPIVTLSAGLAKDDADGSLLSAGVALGPLKLGIGRLNNGSVNGADRKGWVATFALSASGPRMP
jgi:hypothetical protein